MYYLAYGSNLSLAQMSHRCPNARVVGVSTIHDYQLLFKGSGSGNYATIEPRSGCHVPVLVWEISESDERSLDRYEGFPSFYYKKKFRVSVHLDGSGTKRLTCMAYIMDECRSLGLPSAHYFGVLAEGYLRFGFDCKILCDALVDSE